MDYKQSIKYLESLPTPDVWGLKNATELAKLAGVKFGYEIIHVAGTNGKGSVCADLASILQKAGCKTGMFTSPHLQKHNERVKINGRGITDGEFAKMVAKIGPYVEKMRRAGRCPSVFEALTVAAFLYFSEMEVEVLVLETGMGGRLDATNIAPSKLQAITSISFDHMQNLGSTLEKIAFEKAGIIKAGSTVICANGEQEAISVIERKCKSLKADLKLLGRDFSFENSTVSEFGGKFDFREGKKTFKELKTHLIGHHQHQNASLAISAAIALREKGWDIPTSAIYGGIATAKWPGRLEIIPGKPKILLDGAHNLDGMAKLKDAIGGIFQKRGRKLVLVIGIMADKEYVKMINLIAPVADEIVFTRAAINRSANPAELAKSLDEKHGFGSKLAIGNNRKAWGKNAMKGKLIIESNLKQAIACARNEAGRDGLVLVTGSLYLVGEARGMVLRNG